MNCDCINSLERRLAAKFQNELGTKVDAKCMAVALVISDLSLEAQFRIDFKVTAQAKGFVKGKTLPVIANYCPFCGKLLKKGGA